MIITLRRNEKIPYAVVGNVSSVGMDDSTASLYFIQSVLLMLGWVFMRFFRGAGGSMFIPVV